jgi:Spy/CpxP family protein refolding chaperone
MLGDAYFQLRAQVGTGLFSLLRLAGEAGAQESTQAALQAAQAQLRDSFTFAALGPQSAGKSTLLNTLFEREFCGPANEAVAGKIAVYQYGEEARDETLSAEAVDCQRPHMFLRDFTIVEPPAALPVETVLPYLAHADLILYVISAAAGLTVEWPSLSRLGRDLLKRLVFVVWQSDRVSSEEGANAVKRLRQAMLKQLGQACPIFVGSNADRASREKLERWIETEVIFSAPRRAKLREIDETARAALREIVNKPRAERQAVGRKREQVARLRAALAEREEQSERQVAGALWTLGQSAEGLRKFGESLLREHLGPLDLLWKRQFSPRDFASEIEAQTRASLTIQLHDQLEVLEADLRESAMEYLREIHDALESPEAPAPPPFPRAAIEKELAAMDQPLEVGRVVLAAFSQGMRAVQMPVFAAIGVVTIAIGALVAGLSSPWLLGLAAMVVAFVLLLAFLLRRNVIAVFGRHFAQNRADLLTQLDPPLRSAVAQFYAALVPVLDARAETLAGEDQRHEPLLARLQQIEETFARLEEDLRTGLSPRGTGE